MKKVLQFGAGLTLVPYTGFLFWMATRPGDANFPWLERFWDKLLHVEAFFVIGVLGVLAAGFPNLSSRKCARRGFWVGVYAFIVGGTIELLQARIPGRSCERADLVADLVGAAVAVLVMVSILRRQERLQRASHS